MQAACTAVGFLIAIAWSALQRNGSTPSEANVARSGGGSSAEVEATGKCELSSAIVSADRRVQEWVDARASVDAEAPRMAAS